MRLRFQSVAGLAWVVTAAPACVLVLGDFDKGSAATTGAAGTGAVTSGGGDTTMGSAGGTATSSGGSVTGGRDVGGPSNDRGLGIAIDSQGNAVVTGYFGGAVDFGDGHPLTAAGSSDAFIAQYSPTGALNWVVQVGDTGAAMGSAVTVDASDTVYVVGSFTNQFTFDASTTTGGPGFFLAKLDKSGAVQGSNGYFGSGLVQSPEAIAVSPDGTTVAVAGEVSGTLAIGGTMIQTAGDLDGFVFTVDSATGNTGWVQQVKDASGGDQSLYGVTIDADYNVVVAGEALGNVDFGDGAVMAPGTSYNVALAKYAAGGAKTLWKQLVGETGNNASANAVALGSNGEIFLTGSFVQHLAFGAVSLDATPGAPLGTGELFVARLDTSGTAIWGQAFTPTAGGKAGGAGVAADAHGVVVGGTFSGSLPIGATTLASVAGRDGFAMKLDVADGGVLWARSFGEVTAAGENAGVLHVALDPTSPLGASAVVGYFREQIDVGMGPVDTMGYYDAFFARLGP